MVRPVGLCTRIAPTAPTGGSLGGMFPGSCQGSTMCASDPRSVQRCAVLLKARSQPVRIVGADTAAGDHFGCSVSLQMAKRRKSTPC